MSWKAKFIPQAWINGYAVEVDALAENTWEITSAAANEAIGMARNSLDWDYLREDDRAPEWVREYPGPFEVELITPAGEAFSAYDAESGRIPS